jgi:hypothetical protein
MKVIEWCRMDETDFYLSRCIKNWAAGNQPPANGRGRLLQAASSPPVQRDRQIIRAMTTLWTKFFGREWVFAEGDWLIGPQAYSRTWSLHVVANWRLAF